MSSEGAFRVMFGAAMSGLDSEVWLRMMAVCMEITREHSGSLQVSAAPSPSRSVPRPVTGSDIDCALDTSQTVSSEPALQTRGSARAVASHPSGQRKIYKKQGKKNAGQRDAIGILRFCSCFLGGFGKEARLT